MSEPADLEWIAFRRALEQAIGVPLHRYKEPQMKRRLASFMMRRGFESWARFRAAIVRDERLLADVRDMLTINVSEFFRQPERFADLQQRIIPELLQARRPLKVWSAGCSVGCEPYTLGMILDQVDPGRRHRVIGTDVDAGALERAREGRGYLPAEVRSVPADLLEKYFEEEDGGTYRLRDRARRFVTFEQRDLLSDPYPTGVDLILCRNVVIYFTEAAKRAIYAGFAKALRPGGYLFIGGSEMILRSQDVGLQPSGMSFYRKAA